MKEFIEKLIGRLEEKQKIEASFKRDYFSSGVLHGYRDAISTINQLAEEHNNGWIPCEVELPKIPNSYLVTKMCENDGNPIYDVAHEIFWTKDEKWDCERDEDCEWKVIAWQNKLAPYQPERG